MERWRRMDRNWGIRSHSYSLKHQLVNCSLSSEGRSLKICPLIPHAPTSSLSSLILGPKEVMHRPLWGLIFMLQTLLLHQVKWPFSDTLMSMAGDVGCGCCHFVSFSNLLFPARIVLKSSLFIRKASDNTALMELSSEGYLSSHSLTRERRF